MATTIYVGAVRLKVSPKLDKDDFLLVRKAFTYIVHNYQFTTQHQLYGWNGQKTLFYKDQSAPAGCLYRMQRILKQKLGHKVTIVYENDYTPKGTGKIHGFSLEEFQQVAVKRAVKYRRGIVDAPVRAGKTAIAAAIISRVDHFPVWVVTNGKDLVWQTAEALEYHLKIPVGTFSEGKFSDGTIIVTSYQAILRALTAATAKPGEGRKLKQETRQRNKGILRKIEKAKVFIFDECHHALSPKTQSLFSNMKSAGYVIGLSGTPKPDGVNKLELEAAIGAVISKVRYETLINHGRIARPMITVYKMPYSWYSTSLQEFADVYESNIVQNVLRNIFIADIAKKLKKANKTTFIMIRKLDHGPILRALIPGSVFVHGKIPSARRKVLYAGLQHKDIMCIIATVGKEGLNIPKLDAVINAEGYKATTATMQKMRSLTASKDKKYGHIIDFIDRGKFIGKHSNIRIKLYKSMGSVKLRVRQVPPTLYSTGS